MPFFILARKVERYSRSPWRMLVLPVLLNLAVNAHAEDEAVINPDRPGIADGSRVVGAGRIQIEVGMQKEYRRNGPASDQRVLVPSLLRMGLDDLWEVRFEGNTWTAERTSDPAFGVRRSHGVAPTSVGLKYQFGRAEAGARVQLGAIARVFPASGTHDFESRHTTGDVRLVADWDFATRWSLNPNVGVALYEDDRGKVFRAGLFAITLNYMPSDSLSFFVDTGMQTRERNGGHAAVVLDAGVAYLWSRDVQFDFSFGVGKKGETTPRKFGAFGLSVRF